MKKLRRQKTEDAIRRKTNPKFWIPMNGLSSLDEVREGLEEFLICTTGIIKPTFKEEFLKKPKGTCKPNEYI